MESAHMAFASVKPAYFSMSVVDAELGRVRSESSRQL
jgi:hypothetical protein